MNSEWFKFKPVHLFLGFVFFLGNRQVMAQCTGLDFSWNNQNFCNPATIIFTPSNVPSGATFNWIVDGSPASISPTLIYTFTSSGQHTVRLNVTQGNGTPCQSITKTLTTYPRPQISYTTNPSIFGNYCSGGVDVTFQAQSNLGISQTLWLIDNINYTSSQITHRFTKGGTKIITLQVLDSNGCSAIIQDTLSLNVVDTVVGNFTLSKPQGCIPFSTRLGGNLNLTNGTTLDSLVWKFPGTTLPNIRINGPISNSKIPNRNLSFNQTGIFPVELYAYLDGCIYQINGLHNQILSDDKPTLNHTLLDDTVCINDWTYAYNLSTNKANALGNFSWSVPGGQMAGNSTDSVLRFRFNTPGKYKVNLIYSGGCTDSSNAKTIYALGPKALIDRGLSVRLGCSPPFTANFFHNAILPTTGTNNFLWTFYDTLGNVIGTDTAQSPSFTYLTTGSYDVSLQITNSITGCSNTQLRRNFVVVGNPNARIANTPPPGQCIPGLFDMTPYNTTTHQDGYGYQWIVRDNTGSVYKKVGGKTPKISIEDPGIYSIQLVVRNGKNCIDTATKLNYLIVEGIAGVINTPANGSCFTNGSLSHNFFLDSLTIYPPPGSAPNFNYNWQLVSGPANGASITNQNAANTPISFTEPGCYVFSLDINSGLNCAYQFFTDTICLDLETNLVLPTTNLCAGGSMLLDDSISINIDSNANFFWQTVPAGGQFFPNDSAATPYVTFPNTGNYEIYKSVWNKFGCLDTLSKKVQVYNFSSTLTASDTFINCGPEPVIFKCDAPNAAKYNWFINGFGLNNIKTTTTAPTDSIIFFVISGHYDISCVAETFDGCTDSTYTSVFVDGPMPRLYTTSPNEGCHPLTVAFQDTSTRIDSLIFDFGDGSPIQLINTYPMGQSFQHTYTFPTGQTAADSFVYEATLLALSSVCPNPIVLKEQIIVFPNPIIHFSNSVQRGCEPFYFEVYDSSTFAGDSGSFYVIDYGDGTIDTSYQDTIGHVYNTSGTFSIHYQVFSRRGCMTDTILTNWVTVDPSPRAGFSLSADTICFPNQPVQFTDTSLVNGTGGLVDYTWTFGDSLQGLPTSKQVNPTFTFSGPGTYWVSLKVVGQNGCPDSIFVPNAIFIWDTISPDNNGLELVDVVGEDIFISWNSSTDPNFKHYQIQKDTGTGFFLWQTISDSSTTSILDSNVNVNQRSYKYRLIVEDNCFEQTLDTNFHNSIFLISVGSGLGEISLNWTPYEGYDHTNVDFVQNYQLFFRLTGSTNWSSLVTLPRSETTFTVSGLCDTAYQFKVIATLPDTLFSESNESESRPIYNFPQIAPDLFTVTVENNQDVRISWEPTSWPNFDAFVIDRKVNDNLWDLSYSRTTLPTFLDQNVAVDINTYAYRLRMVDVCGKTTDTSDFGTSILLSTDADGFEGIKLIWTPYEKWNDGIQKYTIWRGFKGKPLEKIDEVSSNTLTYSDFGIENHIDKPYCYQIIAHRNNGQHTSESNIVCDAFPSRLFVPNAFSPNNDGINDEFIVSGVSLTNYEMVILDRWGNTVFESNDIREAWDGRDLKGKLVPPGAYVYTLKAKGVEVGKFKKQGSIRVIY